MLIWRLTITQRPNNHFLRIAGAWSFTTENVKGIGQIFYFGHKHKQAMEKGIAYYSQVMVSGVIGLVGWLGLPS